MNNKVTRIELIDHRSTRLLLRLWRRLREPEFTALGRYEITGKGLVFTVACPIDWWKDANNAPFRLGRVVRIDGKRYRIRGIESYAIPCISKGKPIGLLVTELT